MTYDDAVAESKHGIVRRFREHRVVLVNHVRNVALLYHVSDDDFERTTVTPEELELQDWQPVGDPNAVAGRWALCEVCRLRPAALRCTCGRVCCTACLGTPHRDGPHMCLSRQLVQ